MPRVIVKSIAGIPIIITIKNT